MPLRFARAFWHADRPITARQAVHISWQLGKGRATVVRPHSTPDAFLQELARQYSPIGSYVDDDDDLDDCPWSADFSTSLAHSSLETGAP